MGDGFIMDAAEQHGIDGRLMAAQAYVEGRFDPDRWFDNVEKAMLLLSQPRFAKNARFGYCRGKEPVRYVRRIQTLYEAYTDIPRG